MILSVFASLFKEFFFFTPNKTNFIISNKKEEMGKKGAYRGKTNTKNGVPIKALYYFDSHEYIKSLLHVETRD